MYIGAPMYSGARSTAVPSKIVCTCILESIPMSVVCRIAYNNRKILVASSFPSHEILTVSAALLIITNVLKDKIDLRTCRPKVVTCGAMKDWKEQERKKVY